MNEEIERINRILLNAPAIRRTAVIEQWKRSVVCKMEHKQLMEAISLLELALWKRKLDDSKEEVREVEESTLGVTPPAKKSKIDVAAARQEKRITSGASIVIKNVLPFLSLE